MTKRLTLRLLFLDYVKTVTKGWELLLLLGSTLLGLHLLLSPAEAGGGLLSPLTKTLVIALLLVLPGFRLGHHLVFMFVLLRNRHLSAQMRQRAAGFTWPDWALNFGFLALWASLLAVPPETGLFDARLLAGLLMGIWGWASSEKLTLA